MPHYLDPNHKIHFLTDEDILNGWGKVLPEGSEQITDELAAQIHADNQATLELKAPAADPIPAEVSADKARIDALEAQVASLLALFKVAAGTP